MTTRRRLLRALSGGVLLGLGTASAYGEDIPIQGEALPGFEGIDRAITGFMAANQIPGASFALGGKGRLIYARGYGWSDRENQVPFLPTTLSRIASASKPFTATALMKLVEAGRLQLEDFAFPLLGLEPFLLPGATVDPRLQRITIRQLLHHTAGWDRDQSFDPVGSPLKVIREMAIEGPPDPTQTIRYMMGKPLEFDPGTRFAYSNLGFLILGRIIEKVSSQPYERFVREQVLTPSGIRHMRIGRGRLEERAPEEAHYYEEGGRQIVSAYSQDKGKKVPAPYCYAPEKIDSCGGWLASAIDLVRFASAFEALPGRFSLVNAHMRQLMRERPAPPVGIDPKTRAAAPSYYGLGWHVYPIHGPDSCNLWHGGRLPGVSAEMNRSWNGIVWAILFNSEDLKGSFAAQIERQIEQAISAVLPVWPVHRDLFDQYT